MKQPNRTRDDAISAIKARWVRAGLAMLMSIPWLPASGCQDEMAGADTPESREVVDMLAEHKKIEDNAESEPARPVAAEEELFPCETGAQLHTMPTEELYDRYLPFFGDNGTFYAIDMEGDDTLSYNNEMNEWAWSQPLDAQFDVMDRENDWIRMNMVKTGKALTMKSGIVFGTAKSDALLLTRFSSNGDMTFDLNLTETLSLNPELLTKISFMDEGLNDSVLVVISTDIQPDPVYDAADLERLTDEDILMYESSQPDEVVVASIAPDGTVIWQRNFGHRRLQPTSITARRDGTYILTGATTNYRSNSVLWFLNHSGELIREFEFIKMTLPPVDGGDYDSFVDATTLEAEDGTLYVAGYCYGYLTVTDAALKSQTFNGNIPGMGFPNAPTRPYFIFQLDTDLRMKWAVFDTLSAAPGLFLVGAESFHLVNNDTIAILGELSGEVIIAASELNAMKLTGSQDGLPVMAWVEYSSTGAFLWARSLSSKLSIGDYRYSNVRFTDDNRLKITAVDHNGLLNFPLYFAPGAPQIPMPDGQYMELEHNGSSFAAEVTFCPPQ
ncbi:MAG: hypothetical protein JXX14_10625 [Deltaproteobacteria bacterium]|nr:hypothetical protein [Deltaproteobacteria bacterium]